MGLECVLTTVQSTGVPWPAAPPGLSGQGRAVPAHCLASRSLLGSLAWPTAFLVESRESAMC